MKNKSLQISVIGDGGWGTTLAAHLTNKGYTVSLWGPFPENLREIKQSGFNKKFLPGIRLPKLLKLQENLKQAIESADIIVFAVPSKFSLSVLKQIRLAKVNCLKKMILSVTKGFDNEHLLRISEIIRQELGLSIQLAVLSGPNIAREVAMGVPSTAVIASSNINTAKILQNVFNTKVFRIYTNTDVVGVELGGSLKNIIALACGICDGLGYGTNTKAALLTRGLNEISLLGIKLGAKKETFTGLAGLGDLVTTAFNPTSRNRSVGQLIGEGKNIKKILNSMDMVAEGVETVKGAYHLSKKHGISMPITKEVYNILYKSKKPAKAVADLMSRQIKSE